jgi:uncharacterized protein YdeI (BOF family)
MPGVTEQRPKFCESCGSRLSLTANFCPECGTTVWTARSRTGSEEAQDPRPDNARDLLPTSQVETLEVAATSDDAEDLPGRGRHLDPTGRDEQRDRDGEADASQAVEPEDLALATFSTGSPPGSSRGAITKKRWLTVAAIAALVAIVVFAIASSLSGNSGTSTPSNSEVFGSSSPYTTVTDTSQITDGEQVTVTGRITGFSTDTVAYSELGASYVVDIPGAEATGGDYAVYLVTSGSLPDHGTVTVSGTAHLTRDDVGPAVTLTVDRWK